MKAVFKLILNSDELKLIGLELQESIYTTRFVKKKDQFRYIDTVTLNYAVKLNALGEALFAIFDLQDHKSPDISTLYLTDDGWYKVVRIVLPTLEWLLNFVHQFGEKVLFENYSNVYVYHEDKIYKYKQKETINVSAEEIFEINTEGTTIGRNIELVFNMHFLNECYYRHCLYLLNKMCPLRCNSSFDNIEYFHWKFLFMLRSVISYLIEFGRFAEALQLLDELLNTCENICHKLNNTDLNTFDCGCSKRT